MLTHIVHEKKVFTESEVIAIGGQHLDIPKDERKMNGPVAVGGEDGVIEGAAAPSDMKSLRCCISCRLVKSFEQFYDEGCDNCPYLQMREDAELIDDCTTTEFNVR